MVNSSRKMTAPEKIAHIGIAVQKIEQALPFYTTVLGLTLEKMEEIQSEGVKVAFLKIGDTRFELLEPLHDTSPINTFLQKRGEGIHHIALEVDNLESRLRQMKKEGVRLIDETPKVGANDSQVAFIHPKAANGVLMELCEHQKGAVGHGHV